MKTISSAIVHELNVTYGLLKRDAKEGFEVALFMDIFTGRFRVLDLVSLEGDLIHAVVRSAGQVQADDRKKKQYVLLHAGQAIWTFDVVPVEAERIPIGFAQPTKPRPVA